MLLLPMNEAWRSISSATVKHLSVFCMMGGSKKTQ